VPLGPPERVEDEVTITEWGKAVDVKSGAALSHRVGSAPKRIRRNMA
jgi:hypothetical protein